MDNNLPAPYLMDTYLEGYAACLRQLGYLYPERVAMRRIYTGADAPTTTKGMMSCGTCWPPSTK